MSVQTSYDTTPAVALPGQLGSTPDWDRDVFSGVAENLCVPGQVLLNGTAGAQSRPIVTGDTPVADTDAISTAFPAGTAAVTASGGDLDGVVGGAEFWPPRNVTFTLNSHADWNVGTITTHGLNWRGEPIQETVYTPDAGAVTLTGSVFFSKIISYIISAMGGTAATVDVGLGVKIGPVDKRVRGVCVHQSIHKELDRTDDAYADKSSMPVLRRGRIFVLSETTTVDGDDVYVRFVVAGAEVYGAVRATPDSTDCGLWLGAKFRTVGTGSGLREIEVG